MSKSASIMYGDMDIFDSDSNSINLWEGLRNVDDIISNLYDLEDLKMYLLPRRYAELEFYNFNNTLVIYLRLGNVGNNNWILQIVDQDETLRNEDNQSGIVYRDNKFTISNFVSPYIDIQYNVFYIRGRDRNNDYDILRFNCSIDYIFDLMKTLRDFSETYDPV